jgi:hypothetical protein
LGSSARGKVVTLRPTPERWGRPRDILLHELRAVRCAAGMRRLRTRWPTAWEVALGMASYLTELVPGPGGDRPLLQISLLRAVRQGDAAIRGGEEGPDALRASLRGLFAPVPFVMQWRVSDRDTGEEWDAMGDAMLHDWRLRRRRVAVERRPAEHLICASSADTVRLSVAVRLLHTRDLSVLGGDLREVLGELDA